MIARWVLVVALGLAAPAAAHAALDESGFRSTRALTVPGPGPNVHVPGPVPGTWPRPVGPARFEPDGPLYAHARAGFADLRIVDAAGKQVPWRTLPEPEATPPVTVTVLNRGRRDGRVEALLDLGPRRRVHDRIELQVPERDSVGRVEVSGSDDRRTFTKLSTTVVYDLAAAKRGRSTAVVYPPSDFRYLAVSATGISSITGATVAGEEPEPTLVTRRIRRLVRSERGDADDISPPRGSSASRTPSNRRSSSTRATATSASRSRTATTSRSRPSMWRRSPSRERFSRPAATRRPTASSTATRRGGRRATTSSGCPPRASSWSGPSRPSSARRR